MTIHTYFLLFLWIMLKGKTAFAQNPDLGRILLGIRGNITDPTAYTFNGNVLSTPPRNFLLPFSAVVYSGTSSTSQVSKRDEINVTCENEFGGVAGYTQVAFTSTHLAAAELSGNVSYRLTSPGRAAIVRCYGVSTNPASVCPATNNQSVPQPQFCRKASQSQVAISITVTPAPVVSICERVILIPGYSTNTYNGTFQIELSETVRNESVTVTCRNETDTSTYCSQFGVTSCCNPVPGQNYILIPPTTIAIGQKSGTMNFRVNAANTQDICLGVVCSAASNSLLPPDSYPQYATATSSDSRSYGLIKSFTPEVKMEPQYLAVFSTSFQSVLYVDKVTNIDVKFQCQASVVTNLAEADARVRSPDCNFTLSNGTSTITPTPTTTPATTTTANPTTTTASLLGTTNGNATTHSTTMPLPSTTTPLPTPPPDPSSPWVAIDNSFIVNGTVRYHAVRTSREKLVIAPIQEVVVTTCCPILGTSDRFKNLKIATVTVAELSPLLNTSGGVTSGSSSDERFIIHPAYKEVAPCPCDLTYGACDVSCCCDLDCTAADKTTFSSCIPGRTGGQDPGPDLRRCQSSHFPQVDWFPFLCVQFESNALLGQFFGTDFTATLTTIADTDSRLAAEGKSDKYSYKEMEERYTDLATVTNYTDGTNILTVTSQGAAGSLPLPQRSSHGQCRDSTPVQFLRNSNTTCIRSLTQSTCADLTPFSARMYVQASSLFSPACPRSFTVSSTGNLLEQGRNSVKVQVNYYCVNEAVDGYVKATNPEGVPDPFTVYTFAPGLENKNCSDLCGAGSICLERNRLVPSSPLSRCGFDSSFVQPDVPHYNTTTQRCNNVVLDVKYRLSWAGGEVTGFTADIVLGNVLLAPGRGADVSQKFSAEFVHSYSGPSNQSDNFDKQSTAYDRSGRPGYDFGKPLATGCNATNATTGDRLPVDQSVVKQLGVWSPGAHGLCLNASRRFLTFGDDLVSGCALHLTFSDLDNCDSLKELVLKHLNVLMPSNVIGRLGYNDPNNDGYWIEVLREDPYANLPQDVITTTTASTTASTTTLNTTTSNPNTTNSNPNTTTSNPNTTSALPSTPAGNVTEAPFDPQSVRRGVCSNVVSGIHLEIMYAETGRSNNYPLLQIIGAGIRYTLSNWSMSCNGLDMARCRNNSNSGTQRFYLGSSVHFTRVSAKAPQKPILFYQIHNKASCNSPDCNRFYEDFDTSICHYDTCWHELGYPVTGAYRGYDGVNHNRAFTLLCVLFIMAYAAVSKK